MCLSKRKGVSHLNGSRCLYGRFVCLHLLSVSLSPRLSQFKAQGTEAKWKVTPGRLRHV